VLISKLLWHLPCTNFLVPEVLVGDGVCRSISELVNYISDRNPSVLLNHCINLFSIVYHLWSGWTSSSAILILPLWNFSTQWCTFLCVIQFSAYYENILLCILEVCTPSDYENWKTAQQWCNLKAELTCLHFDCPSFTECNGFPMTCLALAQYEVYVMSTRAQSDKLPCFYTHIALTFWISFT